MPQSPFVLASGGTPPTGILRVDNNSGIHQNGGAAASTTVALTLPAALAANVSPIVWVGTPALSVTKVEDNTLANTYTPGPTITSSGYTWSGFYCLNITNAPTTIMATVSESTQFSTIVVDGFSGLLSGGFDGSTSNPNFAIPSTTNITSNAITPTANGDLIVGATVNVGGSGSIGLGSGFTAGVNASPDFFSEYLVQATAASIAAIFTHTTADGFYAGVMAFKKA